MLDGIDSCIFPVADGWLVDVRSLVLELEAAAATRAAALDPDILSDPFNYTRHIGASSIIKLICSSQPGHATLVRRQYHLTSRNIICSRATVVVMSFRPIRDVI